MKANIKFVGRNILRVLFLTIGLPFIFVIAFIFGGIDAVFGKGLYDSFYRALKKIQYWFRTGRCFTVPAEVKCIDCKNCYKNDDNNYWCSLENCIVEPLLKEECPAFEPMAKSSLKKTRRKND